MPQETEFISVEIEIKTDGEHDAFVEWFTAQDNYVQVLPCDTHQAYIFFAPIAGRTPDAAIKKICSEFPQWPPAVQQQWELASFRRFYIGYQLGDEPFCFVDEISAETLRAAAALGAGIGWALYRKNDADD